MRLSVFAILAALLASNLVSAGQDMPINARDNSPVKRTGSSSEYLPSPIPRTKRSEEAITTSNTPTPHTTSNTPTQHPPAKRTSIDESTPGHFFKREKATVNPTNTTGGPVAKRTDGQEATVNPTNTTGGPVAKRTGGSV